MRGVIGLVLSAWLLVPATAGAQGMNVAFGGLNSDPGAPVEVSSDALSVNQENGSAEFTGNVVIGQGSFRLSAPRVLVIYDEETRGIARLQAEGGVTLVSAEDAAEAEAADYDVSGGIIVMTGNVLLTQGQNAISSAKMTVDVRAGTAQMAGRVKTLIVTEDQ